MRLTTLSLRNFRNHTESHFDLADKTNVLLGDNGQGKTTVVEAISYLCLTKSFFAGSDADVLNFNAGLFEIEGVFRSDGDVETHVRVAYERETGRKAVLINGQSVVKFSEVIGRFPVVVSSPDHSSITMGSPAERRKFADFVISQASKSYLAGLVEYRRIVRQRNRILGDIKYGVGDSPGLLESWDEQLIKTGAAIMARRSAFVSDFKPFLEAAHRDLSDDKETPLMEYEPFRQSGTVGTEEDFRVLLTNDLRQKRTAELRTGSTLVGPHRDEFTCTINGHDLRKYASQGQHKTYLVALKMAEFFYLHERCHEMPLLLLDDIFSELDEHRAVRLLNFVGNLSQTFITSTTLHVFDSLTDLAGRGKRFLIEQGSVIEQSPLGIV